MEILILQLGDIHFRPDRQYVLERVQNIKRAVQSVCNRADAYIVAVCGDIAHSGQEAEYEIADKFFNDLSAALKSISSETLVEFVFIPGNHDCDYSSDQRSRNLNRNDLLKNPPTSIDESDSRIKTCLQVQESFFKFVYRRSDKTPAFSMSQKLLRSTDLSIGNKRIRVNCYNTAWLCQLDNDQGDLLAATWIGIDTSPSDLSISLLHHPSNWIEPTNARILRDEIQSSSDIILTGHEHSPDQYTKSTIGGENMIFLEGAPLQGDTPSDCGFNIVLVDLDKNLFKVTLHKWDTDIFSTQTEGEWLPFIRNKKLKNHLFQNETEFSKFLDDPGMPFTHPRVPALKLSDIFIYPDFEGQFYANPKSNSSKIIHGNNILSHIKEHKQVFIIGGDYSGKSMLSKTIYRDLRENNFMPLLIDGASIKQSSDSALNRILEKNTREQYGPDVVERYMQFDKQLKVVIIDDFHKCKAGKRGRNAVVGFAQLHFDIIVIFADELFALNELIQQDDESSTLLAFTQCRIQPLGHRLRGHLIEKWIRLGQEYNNDIRETERQVAVLERTVSTVIGNHLLPPHPFFILGILQGHEAITPHNTTAGSYGYYCQALITNSLSRGMRNVLNRSSGRRVTEDTIHTFLANLAYRIFEQNAEYLTNSELDAAISEYQEKHQIDFDKTVMLEILEEASILQNIREGAYGFRHKYVYFYFVASYLAQGIRATSSEVKVRKQIDSMIGKIHVEDYSNIIILLMFLTQDELVISQILAMAKSLFADVEPCNFEGHLAFLTHLFRVALIALHNFVEKLVANRQCILDIQPPVHGVQKEFHHRQYFIGIYADLPQFSGLLSIY